MYYFYLLQSIKKLNEIYAGSTKNLKIRLKEHNQGKVISTKRYMPWKLVYYEAYLSERDARIREQKIKKHGKGNDELKKRIKFSLKKYKEKGESKGLPLTFLIKKGEGFTLIEILIVIGITIALTAVVVPIYGNLQVKSQLNENSSQIIQTLRTARQRSVARFNNEQHGVKLLTNGYILYQDLVDSDYDREVILDESMSLSWNLSGGADSINFSKGLGLPDVTGTVTLTNEISGSRSIIINSFGLVEEE